MLEAMEGPSPTSLTPGQAAEVQKAAIAAAWRKLEGDWANEDAHRRFIALCATCGALNEAGRLYRNVRDNDPTRADEAKRRLNGVMMAAVEQLSLARTPPASQPKRIMWLIVGACGIYVLYAVLTLLRARNQ